MDGDNENPDDDDLGLKPENSGYWLKKKTSEASVYHSAENIAVEIEEGDSKSTTKLYPKLSEELREIHTPNRESLELSNSIMNESPSKVDTLVLRSAGKYSKPHECISLDNLHPKRSDALDSASLLTIESAVLFDDRDRRIDFILVYNVDSSEIHENYTSARTIFESNLKEEGLELEHVYQAEVGLVFVKIHAPWEVLSRYGEILKFKMPMKESLFELPERSSSNVPDFDFSKYYFRNLFSRMTGLAQSVSDLMHPECYKLRFKDCRFSTVYSRDKEYLFDIPRRKEDFFTPAQRSRIVQFILKGRVLLRTTLMYLALE